MKKVICAVAAFAMVAGVGSVASAGDVDFSGTARFRLKYLDAGTDAGATDAWDSRVRVKIHAKTDGGGYVKARFRMLDGGWGNGGNYSPNHKGGGNVWSDYAFVGFKTGKIDIAGGAMPASFSPWFLDDARKDRFRVLYKDGGLAVAFTFDNNNSLGGFSDDWDAYGVTYRQKFSDAFKANVRLVYHDRNDIDDGGFVGSANVMMNFGGNAITLEQSFKETINDGDNQYGGYAEWKGNFGAITPTARVGYTVDGFTADETFGWIMLGGDLPTSRVTRIGQGGDTIFAGVSAAFQASEEMAFQGNLVYMDVDGQANGMYGETPIEVSGQMKYQIGKGVQWLVRAGWLSNDNDNYDDALAAYTQVEVTF